MALTFSCYIDFISKHPLCFICKYLRPNNQLALWLVHEISKLFSFFTQLLVPVLQLDDSPSFSRVVCKPHLFNDRAVRPKILNHYICIDWVPWRRQGIPLRSAFLWKYFTSTADKQSRWASIGVYYIERHFLAHDLDIVQSRWPVHLVKGFTCIDQQNPICSFFFKHLAHCMYRRLRSCIMISTNL